MSRFETLHLPPPADPTARAYKDWLHLNVFVPQDGIVALINTSLHSSPADARARAVGVALGSGPEGEWAGGIEICGLTDARIEPQAVFLSTVSISAAQDQSALLASVRRPEDGFVADLQARPLLPHIGLELQSAFGSGWIGWAVMPVMELSGHLELGGRKIPLKGALGYHDHNWGRWLWGEDVAWEWGTFVLADRTVIVFARSCDRLHDAPGMPHVFLVQGERVFQFAPERVEIILENRMIQPQRRLPGALAAVHPDRAMPDLPGRVTLRGESPDAMFELEFTARSAAQLILAEPTAPGTSYINEISGTCSFIGQIKGAPVRETGMGIFEYVE
ncbi:MAG TPA: hypothetical protein ENJ91_04410 [Rhodobacteraceae bacterium]|nr:hypothetical protein [Paracoccaceae bacterium]